MRGVEKFLADDEIGLRICMRFGFRCKNVDKKCLPEASNHLIKLGCAD